MRPYLILALLGALVALWPKTAPYEPEYLPALAVTTDTTTPAPTRTASTYPNMPPQKEPTAADHCATLGLGPDCGDDMHGVKRTADKLRFKHHPDKGGDNKKFREVQHAFDELVGKNPSTGTYRHGVREDRSRTPRDKNFEHRNETKQAQTNRSDAPPRTKDEL